MSTVTELEETIQNGKTSMEKDAVYVNLRDFYEEMLALGVAKEESYNLPLRDTIGRDMYELQNRADLERSKRNLLSII